MIRFLADASLHHAIVTGCRRREPTIEFLSANEAKLEGVPDPEVLDRAAAQNRILVTSDFQTMPTHFGDFLQIHGSSPGVLLVPRISPLLSLSKTSSSFGVRPIPMNGEIGSYAFRCLSNPTFMAWQRVAPDSRWPVALLNEGIDTPRP